MNSEQLKWAQAHDWYISYFVNAYNTYSVVVLDDVNPVVKRCFGHKEFQALREWAGY